MNVRALRAMIAQDRTAGHIPFCIAANAGTTNTGTIDPLKELAMVAQRNRSGSTWMQRMADSSDSLNAEEHALVELSTRIL
jgi:glutamate/tyrosine decarboxylase-like PLP-dependent enzyme